MGTIDALLTCGVRLEETNPEKLTEIRRSLLKVDDHNLKTIVSRLRRLEICAPETYQEVIRTPRMQERLLALRACEEARQRARAAKGRDREADEPLRPSGTLRTGLVATRPGRGQVLWNLRCKAGKGLPYAARSTAVAEAAREG
jgi:hypothetical protein